MNVFLQLFLPLLAFNFFVIFVKFWKIAIVVSFSFIQTKKKVFYGDSSLWYW